NQKTPGAMMAAMGKAEDLGPEFLDDGQQEVEVTGTLPMSMTTFVGRDLELGFSTSDLGWANVYFVELAPVTSPDLVDGAVFESMGGGSSRSPLQAVV